MLSVPSKCDADGDAMYSDDAEPSEYGAIQGARMASRVMMTMKQSAAMASFLRRKRLQVRRHPKSVVEVASRSSSGGMVVMAEMASVTTHEPWGSARSREDRRPGSPR